MKAKAGNIARYFHLGYCWLIIKAHLKELYLKMKLQGNWFQYKRRDQKSVGSAHKDIFVSLTSHPPRFCTLHLTLKSLLIQSVRPKELILWIGNEENNQPASRKRLWDCLLSNIPGSTMTIHVRLPRAGNLPVLVVIASSCRIRRKNKRLKINYQSR